MTQPPPKSTPPSLSNANRCLSIHDVDLLPLVPHQRNFLVPQRIARDKYNWPLKTDNSRRNLIRQPSTTDNDLRLNPTVNSCPEYKPTNKVQTNRRIHKQTETDRQRQRGRPYVVVQPSTPIVLAYRRDI